MSVFWVVAQCSLVEVYLSFITVMMEAASISETSANLSQTTLRYSPENIHLHTRRRMNLRSYLGFVLFGPKF
jgi:hypothetical protein